MNSFLENKSRFLSLVLRHQPEKANLVLDKEGYAPVNKICSELKITISELNEIVETNDKKRFAYNENKTLLRASQGHSIKNVALTLEKVENPPQLFHGTKEEFLESIVKNGIIKGSRNHVHLSDNEKTAQTVADRRKGKSVILKIDVAFMRAEGIKFYKSENGVYLTDFIDPKYIINDNPLFKKRKI
ncbi:MAG: RNA 2'-phosphotransferase [Bacteroidia bacterium]